MAASRSDRKAGARRRRAPAASPQPNVLITRKMTFCAAHRYENPAWSARKNRAVFGACFNRHGHGHNYELEVSVRGPVDAGTGMVLNLRDIDAILKREVFERFDHRFINKEVAGFETTVPTLENLTLSIWELLAEPIRRAGAALFRVRLWESAELYAELEAGLDAEPGPPGDGVR